jgi:hypothetical protein
MQMTLAFILPTEPATDRAAPPHKPVPWDQLDPAARDAALEGLAQLITRMLAAQTEAANDE